MVLRSEGPYPDRGKQRMARLTRELPRSRRTNTWCDPKPAFPLTAGKYLVTGDRDVTSVLTVHPKDKNGNQRWELADGATLYDVTHLGCRSARYTPAQAANACSPANAPTKGFPVNPGAAMPAANGCHKQDYTVLIVVGLPVTH
jgi:hypothetical protein